MANLIKRAAIALAMLSVVAFFGLRSIEKAMTFHPTVRLPDQPWARPATCEEVGLTTKQGKRIHSCYIRAQGEAAGHGFILHAHGNGGDLLSVYWVSERLAQSGFDVLVFDYEGYGRSGGELPDETGLFADGEAAYRYLIDQRGAKPESIALYGQSLGTTVVTDVASRNPCGALVVESGPSSASDMASEQLPWLPKWLHWVGRNRFASASKIGKVACPVLVIHGTEDRTISVENGRRLFAAARQPKQILEIPGGGHWLPRQDGDHLPGVVRFIRAAFSRTPK